MNIRYLGSTGRMARSAVRSGAAGFLALAVLSAACSEKPADGDKVKQPGPQRAAQTEPSLRTNVANKLTERSPSTPDEPGEKAIKVSSTASVAPTGGQSGRDPRAIFSYHTKQTLTKQFGQTAFGQETPFNVVVGLSDIYGPAEVELSTAKVIRQGGEKIDPLTFAGGLARIIADQSGNSKAKAKYQMAHVEFM